MTVTCPNGHASATSDYCDQCGARLDVARPPVGTAQPTVILPAVDDPDTAAAAPADPCPACAAPRSGGDRFCETCGYDFVEGVPAVAAGSADATGDNDPASVATDASAAVWEAVVSADKGRFERYADAALPFPAHCPERRYALDQAKVQIGRSGSGSGIATPDIDLVGALEDPAISRLHAVFLRQVDGSYAVVDLDSTNGTTVNDDPKPIDAHVPVPLAEGDRVRLGAWTTVTLRRREATQNSCGASTPASSTLKAS